MKPTMELDYSQWRRAAAELFATSKRTLPDFINGQALAVAAAALRLSYKADKGKIRSDLRAPAENTKPSRQSSRRSKPRTLAEMLVIAKYRKTGQWPGEGSTLRQRATWLINRRVRGIGFIKAGWIPAVVGLSKVVKRKPAKAKSSFSGVNKFGKPKGSARPATYVPGVITAAIENTVPAYNPTTNPYAVQGLKDALAFTAADMTEVLAKRLKQDMARNGMK